LLRWTLPGATLLLALFACALLAPPQRVGTDEMAWTLRQGDLVWVLPLRVRKADVVVLRDPLDPARRLLRRVVAEAGQKVDFDESGLRVNGKRLRQAEMGEDGPSLVAKETIWSRPPARANDYYVLSSKMTTRWKAAGKVEVPEGSVYLLADSRDSALDSRWWGPVPLTAIEGVVRAAWGPTDPWRGGPFRLMWPEE
jgi:signal peptidase I